MELAQWVFGVDADCPVQRLQRRLRLLQGVLHLKGARGSQEAAHTLSVRKSSGSEVGDLLWSTYHSDVAEQHGALRVDAQSLLEVDLSQIELLLLVIDHPQTVPGGAGTEGTGGRR